MKFTLSEWELILRALNTALIEEEECVKDLERDVKTDPRCIKELMTCKTDVARLESIIQRIETSTI